MTAAGYGEAASACATVSHSSSMPTRRPGELPVGGGRKTCSSTKRWTSATVRVRVGAGIGYRCPKWAATQVRFRTGADQRYQEFMDASSVGGQRRTTSSGRRSGRHDGTSSLRRTERCTSFGGTGVPGWGISHTLLCCRDRRPGFETIGNATVVVHDRRARARHRSVDRGLGLLRELGALVPGPGGPGRGRPRRRRGVVLARPPRPPQPGVPAAVPRHPHPAARPRRRPDRPRPHPRRLPRRGAGRRGRGCGSPTGCGCCASPTRARTRCC